MKIISGKITDIHSRRIYNGEIRIKNGRIASITETPDGPDNYIMPGFTDAHIHIESSMLVPSQFASIAVKHGTVATVSDPHEIANVCGLQGIEYMLEDARRVPLKFCFGVPSCVPATVFETAGASIDSEMVKELILRKDMYYLAEMMNWPGVLNDDPEVYKKIKAAQLSGKPVDGHAPGLKGDQAAKYAAAGISTDHECYTLEEALDKLQAGMMIQIREGSAAKNYDALHTLFKTHPELLMLCSDDKHPDELLLGHINELVKRSLALGYDLFDVLRAASLNPVEHYKLPVGLLREGDPADFIITTQPDKLQVLETWIEGECVFKNGKSQFSAEKAGIINNFSSYHIEPEQLEVSSNRDSIPVIEAIDGELITRKTEVRLPKTSQNILLTDTSKDILKIAVINRYQKAEPAVAFIKGFGLQNGAIASSVAHDCHNIIAVGDSDQAICRAVNAIMDSKGGLAAVHGDTCEVLPLPVAGILSNAPGEEVGKTYERLSIITKEMGSTLKAPFMLISFMALLVIPSLKLSDKGLFDGEAFRFVEY